jgi:hypothetical protein
MIRDDEVWQRARRVIQQINERMTTARHAEDFQGIGLLAREAFVSIAQAVYDPARHPPEDGVEPSETDAKRMLAAFVAAELPGSSNEDARRFLRSSIMYADAVTHKRSAGRIDAELVVAAIESVEKLIAILGNVDVTAEPWSGIEVHDRYFAWSGPVLHKLDDRQPVPSSTRLEESLRSVGMTPTFGRLDRLRHHFSNGRLQVFETDRRTWRRAVLLVGDGEQVLLVHEPAGAKGKPRITNRGWEGLNAAGQNYQAYPSWRYHSTKPAVIVQNEAESDALGDEWADTPAAFPPKDEPEQK